MDSEDEFANPQKLVVLCKASSLHPLSLKENEEIKSEFQKLAGKGELVFGTAEVNSDVIDLQFTILIQKFKKGHPIDDDV